VPSPSVAKSVIIPSITLAFYIIHADFQFSLQHASFLIDDLIPVKLCIDVALV
jgi:hypothetical protein